MQVVHQARDRALVVSQARAETGSHARRRTDDAERETPVRRRPQV